MVGPRVRPPQPGRPVPPADAGARAFPADLRRLLQLLRLGVLHGRQRGRRFASGTMRWVCAMRGPHCGHGLTSAAERFVDRATQNLLRAFAAGPAGHSHPAQDNLAQVKPPRIAACTTALTEMDDIDARIVAVLVQGRPGQLRAHRRARSGCPRPRSSGGWTGSGLRARSPASRPGWTRPRWAGPPRRTWSCTAAGAPRPRRSRTAVRRYPEVVDACTITGEADALVHIRAADVRHFEDVMERIRAESVRGQDQERDRALPAGRPGRRAGADALSRTDLPSGWSLTS